MKRYKWILFDADHTLFDFDRGSEEALGEVLASHGIGWGDSSYLTYKEINVQCWSEHEQGLIDRDTLVYERFRRYFDHRSLQLDPVSTQQDYLHRLGQKAYEIPGAASLLSVLQGKFQLGYITNGMAEVQRPRMEKIGWQRFFDLIVIAGEIGHSKPHHPYFQHVYEQIGQPVKTEVLVVGDSLTADIIGARQFGFDACWFNPEGKPHGLTFEPDYTIRHLDQLLDILLD